jgi:hypothetical protein
MACLTGCLHVSINNPFRNVQFQFKGLYEYVYIAKASQKEKQSKIKHYTHKDSKGIETFQMSYYVYIQCCNDVKIVKVQKGK